mmetsp:Transcript_6063/g.16983  ORF Transcript_6063/g.16983 Transcript_6063/m.16983 type:complete len:231 (+) Transcript_6063:25-717(+)
MRTAALLFALAATSAAASVRADTVEAVAAAGAGAKPAAATRTRRRRTTGAAAARAVRPPAAGARRTHKVPETAEEVETRVEDIDNAEDLPAEEAPLAGGQEFLTPNEEADASVFIEQEIEAKEEEGLADAAAAVIAGAIDNYDDGDDGEDDEDDDDEDEDLVEGSMSVDWLSMSMAEGSLSMDDGGSLSMSGNMSGAGSVDVRRRRRMTEAANRHRRRRVHSRRAREMTV